MKKYLIVFFTALICGMLITILRGGYITVLGLTGIPSATFFGGIFFFLLTHFFLKRYSDKIKPVRILVLLLIGCCIFELPFSFIHRSSFTLIVDLDTFSRLLSILLGYVYFNRKSPKGKWITGILSLLFFIWLAYCAYPLVCHKVWYGTFTGKTEQALEEPFLFQTPEGSDIYLSELEGDLILLDFWSSSCGICFEEFPDVQRIYDTWQSHEKIKVYSVFCRIEKREETYETGQKILAKRGYTFPALSIPINDPLLIRMDIQLFPDVLIIDSKGNLVFRGSIERAEKFLRKSKI